MMIQMAKDPLMLETTYVAEVESNLISAGVPEELAHLLAIEAQLKARITETEERIRKVERRDVPPSELNALQLASQEIYGSADPSKPLKEHLLRLQNRAVEVRRKLRNLEKTAQATNKAIEILSRSTPDGALSIMERMESKIEKKERRQHEQILVGKAITEIGTTYDREVHPVPTDAPSNDQVWKDMCFLGTIAVIVVIAISIFLLYWLFVQN